MTGVVQRVRWLGWILLSFTWLTIGHAALLEKYDLGIQVLAANSVDDIFRRAGGGGGASVSLKQVKMELGRANMSLKNFELQYVPEILDPLGGRVFGAMATDGAGVIVKGASGRPLIRITDAGLSSIDEAVLTLFHEVHHVRSAMGPGMAVSTEAAAEAYAEKMLRLFQSRAR